MKTPHFQYENEYWQKGYVVIGIDEVGKGCLAGPITVGAVAFAPTLTLQEKRKILATGINDSKQLPVKKREQLIHIIKNQAHYTATASSDVEVINSKGIELALSQAIANIVLKYRLDFPDNKILLLVDGRTIANIPYINDIERKHIVKGDSICVSIAAASIIAKVSRDTYMKTLLGHEKYAWERNKGYGTKHHREAIMQYGITKYHRTLFVRNVLSSIPK